MRLYSASVFTIAVTSLGTGTHRDFGTFQIIPFGLGLGVFDSVAVVCIFQIEITKPLLLIVQIVYSGMLHYYHLLLGIIISVYQNIVRPVLFEIKIRSYRFIETIHSDYDGLIGINSRNNPLDYIFLDFILLQLYTQFTDYGF